MKKKLAVELPDLWSGLTPRQKEVLRLKLRGLSQHAIAKVFSVSQKIVFKEMERIREVHRLRGISLDKDQYAGEMVTKFDEVEEKAWNLFYSSGPQNQKPANTAVQIQALQLISAVQGQKTKLLMELGVLHREARRIEHNLELVRPNLVDTWDQKGRRQLAQHIIVSQLDALPEPEPPEEGVLIEEEQKDE